MLAPSTQSTKPVPTAPAAAIPVHMSSSHQQHQKTAKPSISQNHPGHSASEAARRDLGSRHPGDRDRREQRIGDFIIKQTLGKGTFSKVCMAEHRTTKQKFALKFIKPKSPQGGNNDKHNIRVEREIKLLSLLYHPNIVRLYDVVQTSKFTMIVMEHNSGGELLHYIRKRGRLHENEARVFFRQIVSAMDYTHRNCIIHRDLKLENVMLDGDNRIRIIDFGFANTFDWNKQLDTFCGSPFYAAPEMVNGIKYTGPEVDIWSMGVILFFMLCGRTPFEGENLREIYDKISRGRFVTPPYLSNDAQDLLQKMLTVHPQQRITMKGIVDHSWSNKDCEAPINNYLQQRPAVVLQPNEYSLKKMTLYNYTIDDVVAALAQNDSALTPMVCIYHLIEESRRRKANKNARRNQANSSVNGSSANASSVDVNSHAPGGPGNPGHGAPVISTDGIRPVSLARHSFVPSYASNGMINGDVQSPTSKTSRAPSNSGAEPGTQNHNRFHQGSNHQYLHPKDSNVPTPDSPSFGASQYGQPRIRKSSTASGQISVGSFLNLESSSPFLRDDDKRSSRSSRFFARVRKSMPFLKARRSQILDGVPQMQQSQLADNNSNSNKNRVSFFQSPFRRFSAAPSAMSLASPSNRRTPSYYQTPQAQQNLPPPPSSSTHQNHAVRPATAHAKIQTKKSFDHGLQQRQHQKHTQNNNANSAPRRHTDFGPAIQQNPARSQVPDTPDSGDRRQPTQSGDVATGFSKSQRPLSVSSSRHLTPLRLQPPQQNFSSPQSPTPFGPSTGINGNNTSNGVNGAQTQLPPAVTSRNGASNPSVTGVSSNNKSGVRGVFNLRCTMLGPLDEINAALESVLKSKYIAFQQITSLLYTCEYKGNVMGARSGGDGNGSVDKSLRFEIQISAIQGQLHQIKFKRIMGSWWSYKKLSVAITDELQSHVS